MTPDRRLDQLEPLMADSLQKIDRLIEGQGQILEISTRADQKADITAKGVANLTITVQEGFQTVTTDIDELKAGQARIESTQQEILTLLRERLK